MILLIENGQLDTDLDGNNFQILNVAALTPVPPTLVDSSDPRLSDARIPLDGSVTNVSVAGGAAIAQSKLNLNGVIPPAWLGTGATQAAQGNLVEYLTNRNQPNGYAGLDSGGKVPTAQIPSAVGTGTVTSVSLTMPAQFSVSGSPITGAGTLAVAWANQADQSWFGNKSGAPAAPQFYTTALPAALIPSLDTSIVGSGTFAAARLPVAVGLGGSHAPGAVPDPGAGGGGALATDYLARDMTWRVFPTIGPTYQPTVATPTASASANPTGPKNVSFVSLTTGVNTFYSLTSGTTGFAEVTYPPGYVSVPPLATVWFYTAKIGYNNSAVASYTNPNVV